MKRRWISILVSAVLAICLAVLSMPKPALVANPGDVLIVEVGADPAGSFTDPAGEFIEIYNNTSAEIDVGGWKLCDNSTGTPNGCRTIPTGTTLGPSKMLVIIHATSELGAGGYNCSGTVKAVEFSDGWFAGALGRNLGNDNDHVLLYDTSSNLIDAVSYGTDTAAFDPPASDVFNNTGRTLQRKTYNTDFVDTNAASDWSGSGGAGTPCDVGPTAITLSSLTARGEQPAAQPERALTTFSRWLVAALVGAALVGASIVALRRRRAV